MESGSETNLNTLHFKYAVEVERTKSITQAANNLYITQPSLSKAIKELEDTVGIEIFERTSKGVVPTPKGMEFLAYARNVLEQLDKMEQLSVSDSADRQCFNISIPRGSYIASGFTKFVAELDADKEIDVNVNETNSMQAISNIVDDHYHLGIIRYQTIYENYFLDYLNEKELSYDLIWEFERLALMSKDHPLASVPKVEYDELCTYIEILHGDTYIPYLPVNEYRKTDKLTNPNKRIYLYERCNQFDLLTHIPRTYMWVSAIPKELLDRYDLVQRRCPVANQKYKDLLIYPKGYRFTPLDQKFIDKLYAAKNEVAFDEYH